MGRLWHSRPTITPQVWRLLPSDREQKQSRSIPQAIDMSPNYLVRDQHNRSSHPPQPDISLLELTSCGYVACTLCTYAAWWYKHYNVSEPITIYPEDDDVNEARPSRMDEYTGSRLRSRKLGRLTLLLSDQAEVFIFAFGVVGLAAFGAVHLAAWNYIFANSSAQTLWRVCSILILVSQLVLSIVIYIFSTSTLDLNAGAGLGFVVVRSPVLVYIAVRLILVILTIYSFWCIRIGVYSTTSWSSFLPSIG